MPNTWVLLMAGGKGTRLWPKSRLDVPKQFMPLETHKTLFQQTLERISDLPLSTQILAIVPEEYIPFIKVQAPKLIPNRIIVEPAQHGTTACLGYALVCLRALSMHPDDVVVIVPTDAYVGDNERYLQSIVNSIKVASLTDGLVTIGVTPSYPAAGYGYIHVTDKKVGPAILVDRFIEKPNYERAKSYIQEGSYFWNAGIFAWKASALWNALEKQMPSACKRLEKISHMLHASEAGKIRDCYLELPNMSFEHAIVENTSEIYMIPAQFDWTDVGTWSSLIKTLGASDETKGVVRLDSSGCLVENEQGLVALLGVQDLIVIHTEETVFICHRSREQDIKKILELLQDRGYKCFL